MILKINVMDKFHFFKGVTLLYSHSIIAFRHLIRGG